MTITNTCDAVDTGAGSGLAGSADGTMAAGVCVGWTWALWPLPHAATASIAAMRMAGGRWELEIRPERGGRIVSMRLDGEELLDQGIGIDQPTADGFVEGGAFGWDEMVPNLEPTETLPDHGEAWRLPWEWLGDGVMRCSGRLVPWQLERYIQISDSINVTYVYRNVGKRPHAAYWCAHPLFRYEPDMEVSVEIPRPEEGRSAKVFLPRGSIDRVQVGRLEMSWDSSIAPDAAVWVCNGDLGGYRQIAVEPATTSPVLHPGALLSWWLRISPI